MKRYVLVVLACLPVLGAAQGVSKPTRPHEEIIAFRNWASAITATTYGGGSTGSSAVLVTAFGAYSSSAAVGAGSIVFRVTDGTNVCDCTASCTTTGVTGFGNGGTTVGGKRIACTGACLFPANTSFSFAVQTAGCATTQPTLTTMSVLGLVM